MKLRCKRCGNKERFVKVYETYIYYDGNGNEISKATDAVSNDYYCCECDNSTYVEYEDDE